MVVARWKKWREDRHRFPTRWLTYKQRVREDVERAYRTEEGQTFFGDKYIESLRGVVRQLEEWEIKLLIFQFGISVFIIMGLFVADASISLFGVSLKQAAGVKEILLALSATLALIIYAVSQSKQLRLIILEKLWELREDPKFLGFARLAAPASFNISIYFTQHTARWIFPRTSTKILLILIGVLVSVLILFAFGLSIALWAFLYLDILRRPTIGLWSYMLVGYSGIAHFICFLWVIRAFVRLPFRDMEVLQELRQLEKDDPAQYAKRLQELYPG